ncbi:sel1 repeat family protein, partial [Salmonella enterica subsp. enterica serovar 1,4,[5],12:i:-]|nr:sel1 repeat family protein [Salmonella enterica subsp. enterica serovar 1,4,[5],12:i:-]
SQGQFDQTMDELKNAPSGKQKPYINQLTQWAKEGHTPSQVNLGQMYLQGDFVQKDLRQAYEWTNAAAAKNNPKAQNNFHQGRNLSAKSQVIRKDNTHERRQ